MAIDVYGPEWEENQYAALAPKVEALVNRSFGFARGARFGAQGSILAKRLAALRTEIAMQAGIEKAKRDETMRQETVRAKERQDTYAQQESAKQNEAMRREDERRRENWQRENDYTRSLGDYKKAQLVEALLKSGKLDRDTAKSYFGMTDEHFDRIAGGGGQGEGRGFRPYSPNAEMGAQAGSGFSSPISEGGFRDYASDYTMPQSEVSPVSDIGNPITANAGWRPATPPQRQADKEGRLLVGSPGDERWRYDNGGGGWLDMNTRGGSDAASRSHEGETLWSEPGYSKSSQPVGQSQYKGYSLGTLHSKPMYGSNTVYTRDGSVKYSGSPGGFGEFNGTALSQDEIDRYRIKNIGGGGVVHPFSTNTRGDSGGEFDPNTPGKYTDAYKRNMWGGDWNSGSPRQFKKAWEDTQNTAKNLWSGFSSLWRRG